MLTGLIEHGLTEAATPGFSKQISPTLKSRHVGEDEDEFLEIRYHGDSSSSHPNSPQLSIISMDTASEVDNKNINVIQEEPQSPTIPRDISLNTTNDKYSEINSSSKGVVDSSKDSEKSVIRKKLSDSYGSEVVEGKDIILGLKSTDLDTKPILHIETKSRSSSLNSSSSNPTSPPVILSDNHNPLQNMNSITHIEAVQSGQTLQISDSVIDMEEYSEMLDKMEDANKNVGLDSKTKLKMSLEDSGEDFLKHRFTDSVEELDSPESIQKIDLEDCFSWEEDRLCLTIDHDTEKDESNRSEPDNIVMPLEKDTKIESKKTHSRQQSKTSQKSIIETKEDFKDVDLNPEQPADDKMKSSTESDTKTSPGGRAAAALKNKLSSAMSKFKRGSSSDSSEIQMVNIEKASTAPVSRLQQDDSGFPLVIFTKVISRVFSNIFL